ncbi:MAG: DNA repair protein RecO [Candidatus Taylorbacteria bacterium RIFCSPHIGHO2_02_FULL_44_36]|uniref:DNA repair protein RecO n=1 Tax=Candidatus Taylorbacteria bacterium RIFCSPLOWO2_12_FULL_44_15c TaxID=1802333 RepID=A0A1G2P4V8_9BACT|nr:MAG: DNA repair protein RecO [Candidatus Taylorbacteria bacterium RIFCSPHIGHO2_02_FULL_44_36]OHA37951.1 MAG: DNA repair protein RecO [Candidatus Taylorbacteria bacterium RIFCSPLOWO2_02_FULL_44_35]OHA43368.1 MAG: DNA repair protein RecO [Candidatus Taylorbacteria bacterium RIFCSPLOWO2_12_FULL_44_15c]
MYSIITTSAIVVRFRNSGENGKIFSLFCRELGLVKAHAQGVRKANSKLRSHLADFSLAKVSLVRGKNFWRLTGATAEKNYFQSLKIAPLKLKTAANIVRLLERLLHGEEKNETLFDLVKNGFDFLENLPTEKETILAFETALVLRVLHRLGYLGKHQDTISFAPALSGPASSWKTFDWNEKLLIAIQPKIPDLIAVINQSLHESHL